MKMPTLRILLFGTSILLFSPGSSPSKVHYYPEWTPVRNNEANRQVQYISTYRQTYPISNSYRHQFPSRNAGHFTKGQNLPPPQERVIVPAPKPRHDSEFNERLGFSQLSSLLPTSILSSSRPQPEDAENAIEPSNYGNHGQGAPSHGGAEGSRLNFLDNIRQALKHSGDSTSSQGDNDSYLPSNSESSQGYGYAGSGQAVDQDAVSDSTGGLLSNLNVIKNIRQALKTTQGSEGSAADSYLPSNSQQSGGEQGYGYAGSGQATNQDVAGDSSSSSGLLSNLDVIKNIRQALKSSQGPQHSGADSYLPSESNSEGQHGSGYSGGGQAMNHNGNGESSGTRGILPNLNVLKNIREALKSTSGQTENSGADSYLQSSSQNTNEDGYGYSETGQGSGDSFKEGGLLSNLNVFKNLRQALKSSQTSGNSGADSYSPTQSQNGNQDGYGYSESGETDSDSSKEGGLLSNLNVFKNIRQALTASQNSENVEGDSYLPTHSHNGNQDGYGYSESGETGSDSSKLVGGLLSNLNVFKSIRGSLKPTQDSDHSDAQSQDGYGYSSEGGQHIKGPGSDSIKQGGLLSNLNVFKNIRQALKSSQGSENAVLDSYLPSHSQNENEDGYGYSESGQEMNGATSGGIFSKLRSSIPFSKGFLTGLFKNNSSEGYGESSQGPLDFSQINLVGDTNNIGDGGSQDEDTNSFDELFSKLPNPWATLERFQNILAKIKLPSLGNEGEDGGYDGDPQGANLPSITTTGGGGDNALGNLPPLPDISALAELSEAFSSVAGKIAATYGISKAKFTWLKVGIFIFGPIIGGAIAAMVVGIVYVSIYIPAYAIANEGVEGELTFVKFKQLLDILGVPDPFDELFDIPVFRKFPSDNISALQNASSQERNRRCFERFACEVVGNGWMKTRSRSWIGRKLMWLGSVISSPSGNTSETQRGRSSESMTIKLDRLGRTTIKAVAIGMTSKSDENEAGQSRSKDSRAAHECSVFACDPIQIVERFFELPQHKITKTSSELSSVPPSSSLNLNISKISPD